MDLSQQQYKEGGQIMVWCKKCNQYINGVKAKRRHNNTKCKGLTFIFHDNYIKKNGPKEPYYYRETKIYA